MSNTFGPCGSITVDGGSAAELAVDLNNDGVLTFTGDTTGALTTVFNESGRFALSFIRLSGATAENMDLKLTIDGEVKWDYTAAIFGSNTNLLGSNSGDSPYFIVKSDFLLQAQAATDTSVTFTCGLRRIKAPTT